MRVLWVLGFLLTSAAFAECDETKTYLTGCQPFFYHVKVRMIPDDGPINVSYSIQPLVNAPPTVNKLSCELISASGSVTRGANQGEASQFIGFAWYGSTVTFTNNDPETVLEISLPGEQLSNLEPKDPKAMPPISPTGISLTTDITDGTFAYDGPVWRVAVGTTDKDGKPTACTRGFSTQKMDVPIVVITVRSIGKKKQADPVPPAGPTEKPKGDEKDSATRTETPTSVPTQSTNTVIDNRRNSIRTGPSAPGTILLYAPSRQAPSTPLATPSPTRTPSGRQSL